MNKPVTILLALYTLICCSACSWVDDDRSHCPTGCWLKLDYTYNMLNVDAIATQVKDVTIFILDKDGACIGREEVDSVAFHQNNFMVRIPTLPVGNYTFLVWAGLADPHYQYTPTSLLLRRNEAGEVSERLSSLFHGRLCDVYINNEYRVFTLSLIKDTKLLSCILQSQSAEMLDSDDFRLEITSFNGCMDHWNIPADTASTSYLPFMLEEASLEEMQVIHAGMNTLRFMTDDDTRLKLTYLPTGKTLLNIPITQYLLLSRNLDSNLMEPQEYLDRQDRYNLIFFLTLTGDSEEPYRCMQLEINGWILRLNDAELDK